MEIGTKRKVFSERIFELVRTHDQIYLREEKQNKIGGYVLDLNVFLKEFGSVILAHIQYTYMHIQNNV